MDHYYLDMKTYRRLVKVLAKVKPDVTGNTENAIKIVLGEEGGIWPAVIKQAERGR